MSEMSRRRRKTRRRPASGGGLVHSARLHASNNAGSTRGTGRSALGSLAPWGWMEAAPSFEGIDALDPNECARFRQQLLDWVADGLSRAQGKDDVYSGLRTDTACWDGVVVDVHQGAVAVADAVISLAVEFADAQGYLINQLRRGDAGLDENLDRRVLGCFCDLERCRQAPGRASTLEMRWPVGNAALERQRPDIGFVAPPRPIRFKDVYPNGAIMDIMLALAGCEPSDMGTDPIDTRHLSKKRRRGLLAAGSAHA